MKKDKEKERDISGMNRRDFLKQSGKVLALMAASATIIKCSGAAMEDFLQKNFKEMSRDDLQKVLKRLEKDYAKKFTRNDITVSATPAQPGQLFGYGLDISRCIGCRRCVYACVEENNLPRDPQMHWIRVMQLDKSKGVDIQHAEHYYNPDEVPQENYFYMPVQCQQCSNPPCVKTCPVGATWQEPDGIVVVDYNWCIGCRCCMAYCPYSARHFNWAEPRVESKDLNPKMEYLGNRIQHKGTVSKCTFCIQRTRKGRYPACVEACPVGARKFGNLLDEESEIRRIMKMKRVFIFKEELGTKPKFFYFFAT